MNCIKLLCNYYSIYNNIKFCTFRLINFDENKEEGKIYISIYTYATSFKISIFKIFIYLIIFLLKI